MKSLQPFCKNKKILLSFLILVIILVYLNRSYAYIYDKIDDVGFQSSIVEQKYTIDMDGPEYKKYVVIGDSLTAGVGVNDYRQSYPYLVAQKIADNTNTSVVLFPYGIPGARTQEITEALVDTSLENKPDIVTVLSGVNDVYGNVSKEEFEKDYRNLIKKLTAGTDAKIYVINIPYIGDASLILPPYNYYFDYKVRQFNKIIKEIAVENNLTYIDLYTDAKLFSKNNSYYSLDLFHPSDIGYIEWANSIYENTNR